MKIKIPDAYLQFKKHNFKKSMSSKSKSKST